jgi:hypothetical protein
VRCSARSQEPENNAFDVLRDVMCYGTFDLGCGERAFGLAVGLSSVDSGEKWWATTL